MSALLVLLWSADKLFPLPAPGRDSFNVIVVAKDGTPLRAFPDRAHIWRHPIKLDAVSPYYIQSLIAYEDKNFWWHPGVNPLSLLRATYQWLRYGHIVSGGSTLTMQVARILDPTPRTMSGKLKQIARALQLEYHYSKTEILDLYMNFAPMGGVLEGVEAASRAYLGKPANRLTHAEAALLTVLPQLPSVLRPDRYPQKAQLARNKVVYRMRGIWSTAEIKDALTEPIAALTVREPLLAPLLAQRMKSQNPGQLRIDTTIDSIAQQTVETLLVDRVNVLPPRISMAAMVMDNRTAEVVAYAGSADFTDRERFSNVDMVRASRSPGSTLKPFLYAFALDEGLIHSESLLSDTPQSFSGYQPGNFQQNFHGPVSVSEALVKSLNVPAVQVLDQLGSVPFVAMLRRGGLKLEFPKGAAPNLSVILGGAGARLEDMVAAYSSLARAGMAVTPRFVPSAPLQERRMMSEGAAFIVRDILETGGPVGRAVEGNGSYRGIAWKTGTSFGFRDAWALGVSQRYTIGVWVGRPDGTPNPGFFGANIAAPLLVDIFNALPDGRNLSPNPAPATVKQEKICWPSGTRASDNIIDGNEDLCPLQRTAWTLNGIAPPTFPDRLQAMSPRLTYFVDQQTGKRVLPDCAQHAYRQQQIMRWPAALQLWLDPDLHKKSLPPEWDSSCSAHYSSSYSDGNALKIMGLNDGELIRQANGGKLPEAKLELRGSHGEVNWMVNGRLLTDKRINQTIKFPNAGRYDITAFDMQGNFDRIGVSVQMQ
ncbi:penicillin-binding protein 1C [Solimicrobium silvestre]|uniref:penicillin-binding protein 1C n=1 Tax=Solimicrobium silvestre TaxID=2099400 RepID=UPI001FAF5496|nr:penicillin-binding protein 1C [Solimicrobium silvestre]